MPHTRADAWTLLTEWTESESLRRHALSVEAAMRAYAKKFGEDEELWGNAGLLHDFDYERHPEAPAHPTVGMDELRRLGWPESLIRAIGGHAQYLNISRDTPMEKCLFAVDELCGLIVATTYTRPNRTLAEVTPEAVMKKFRSSGFAKGVNRDDVILGARELGIPLEEHIATCVAALQDAAETLGL